ncbi:ATP-dependent RNA helicase DeaD [Roseimicrobium gellanilyticum]|uniref:RNA helicase n=1 Tax=Roseimicrobium gellanilyticum TaxID=748857 RepID=A0A366H5Y5_9BACT|nr:DEAD/DEAH box helicase [Roseimicrobium gellanilyticum]RBP37342.1 ATP-dependent RNA helicase DeaD [Roseimicrobium gellanilyticum]
MDSNSSFEPGTEPEATSAAPSPEVVPQSSAPAPAPQPAPIAQESSGPVPVPAPVSDKPLFADLGLAPEILQAVTALGFEQPSPIQAGGIPPALQGRDVVGQSQTGSGKTMAFAIPVVQSIDPRDRGVRALIMCPTRELAMQVCEEVHKLTAFKRGIRALPVYGGATYHRQIRGLQDGAQVVVGTPGRIHDLIEKGVLILDDLKLLVFDEADEMLDMGFREDIENLVSLLPEDRQTLFFSATLDGPIRPLVESFTRNPVRVSIAHKALTVPSVEQRFFECMSRSKIEVLCRVLDMENPRLAMVFGNTKRAVDDVTDALMARGYSVDRLHGDLNQTMRDRVMKNFRAGTVEVLACTDVAARGLDVNEVDLVVNFDLPYDEEDYVHRIGRTGRAGRKGKAVSLVSGREIFLLQRIQRYAKVNIERSKVPTREEVEGKRTDGYIEKLQATLDKGDFKSHEDTLQRLLDAGQNSTDIASALMHLWIAESARESEEILEDRPKPERRPREQGDGRFRDREQFQGQGRGQGGDGGFREDRGPRQGPPPQQQGNFTRMFINIGAMDEATPRDIVGAIYKTANLPPGSLGRVEIFEKCSYIGVPHEFVQQVQDAIGGAVFRGRGLRMDIAGPPEGGGGGFQRRPFGGGGGGGFRDRDQGGQGQGQGYQGGQGGGQYDQRERRSYGPRSSGYGGGGFGSGGYGPKKKFGGYSSGGPGGFKKKRPPFSGWEE